MQLTKKTTLFFVSGAVLIAGLFLFERKPSDTINIKELQPEQLNFAESNKVQPIKPIDANIQATDSSQAVTPKLESTISRLKEADLKTWQMIEEIIKSKNDNDPRLDKELKHQSPEVRAALYEKYEAIPNEARNDRGLIAYMIARDFESAADAQFMKKVFEEPPCLSLADCKSTMPEDPHHSGENQITQNYPQMATLFQIEKRLTEHPEVLKDASIREAIASTLRQAESYAVPIVSNKAQQIRTRFGL